MGCQFSVTGYTYAPNFSQVDCTLKYGSSGVLIVGSESFGSQANCMTCWCALQCREGFTQALRRVWELGRVNEEWQGQKVQAVRWETKIKSSLQRQAQC